MRGIEKRNVGWCFFAGARYAIVDYKSMRNNVNAHFPSNDANAKSSSRGVRAHPAAERDKSRVTGGSPWLVETRLGTVRV